MPRAHDCITLYLGSRQRYQQEFDTLSRHVLVQSRLPGAQRIRSNVALGAANLDMINDLYDTYVAKYGKDNADYLIEAMGEWGKHYDRAVFIDMGLGDGQAFEQTAREQAERRGWLFERKAGDPRLLRMLINGEWPADEFLVVLPGHTIRQAGNDGLIVAE